MSKKFEAGVTQLIVLFFVCGHTRSEWFKTEDLLDHARNCNNATHFSCPFHLTCCNKFTERCNEFESETADCIKIPLLHHGEGFQACCREVQNSTKLPSEQNKDVCEYLLSSWPDLREEVCRDHTEEDLVTTEVLLNHARQCNNATHFSCPFQLSCCNKFTERCSELESDTGGCIKISHGDVLGFWPDLREAICKGVIPHTTGTLRSVFLAKSPTQASVEKEPLPSPGDEQKEDTNCMCICPKYGSWKVIDTTIGSLVFTIYGALFGFLIGQVFGAVAGSVIGAIAGAPIGALVGATAGALIATLIVSVIASLWLGVLEIRRKLKKRKELWAGIDVEKVPQDGTDTDMHRRALPQQVIYHPQGDSRPTGSERCEYSDRNNSEQEIEGGRDGSTGDNQDQRSASNPIVIKVVNRSEFPVSNPDQQPSPSDIGSPKDDCSESSHRQEQGIGPIEGAVDGIDDPEKQSLDSAAKIDDQPEPSTVSRNLANESKQGNSQEHVFTEGPHKQTDNPNDGGRANGYPRPKSMKEGQGSPVEDGRTDEEDVEDDASEYTPLVAERPERDTSSVKQERDEQTRRKKVPAPKADSAPKTDYIGVDPKYPLLGQNVIMECFTYGSDTTDFEYKWTLQDKPLPPNVMFARGNKVLILQDAKLENQGTYMCHVTKWTSVPIDLKLRAHRE